ncbi:MAG: exodeoxyribonuclease VII small subunit, partial [Candidatus Caldatribacteriota bacterium]|nr:exodeoxyribonuclease VII small subunit [Candidatus Caldatribacteriota bacterium]
MKKIDNEKNLPFEDYLLKLEEIVKQLEEGDLSLDDSVKLYEKGTTISKICMEKLDKTKQKIEQLVIEDDEKYSVKPFSINKKE